MTRRSRPTGRRSQAAWTRPATDEVFELVFTSGTTGTPKGVMLTHDNVVASIESFHRIVPPMEHRLVSLLPLSHLLEQAVGLYYALDVGADILYVRSRNPRVIFDALRDHRVTSMVVVPQILDLFWSAIEREVEKRGRTRGLRPAAGGRPAPADCGVRPCLFGSVHKQLGGHFRLFLSSGAFLPPALQQAWEDLGVTVLQGYGATETGTGTCTTLDDHGPGTVGRPPEGIEMRLAAGRGDPVPRPDRVQRLLAATPRRPPRRSPRTAGTGPATSAISTTAGRLILSGRTKDIIVLPNGFNVYPEDIENALRVAGIRDSVVVETLPGRIEAVVLAGRGRRPGERRPRGARAGAHRCRRQGRERDARAEPAHRRLAAVARGGLPPHAHPQDQARAGARPGWRPTRRSPWATRRRSTRRRSLRADPRGLGAQTWR